MYSQIVGWNGEEKVEMSKKERFRKIGRHFFMSNGFRLHFHEKKIGKLILSKISFDILFKIWSLLILRHFSRYSIESLFDVVTLYIL